MFPRNRLREPPPQPSPARRELMIKVFFNQAVKSPLSPAVVEKIVNLAARQEKKIQGEVEIKVVGNNEIKKINRLYRGKNEVTDVLSFAWQEDQPIPGNFLGQIYLSAPRLARQAKSFGVPFREEFIRMLVHGLLHLVGYDHCRPGDAKKMFKLQDEIVVEAYQRLI